MKQPPTSQSDFPPFDLPKPCKIQSGTSVKESRAVKKTGLVAMATPTSSTCRQDRKMILVNCCR